MGNVSVHMVNLEMVMCANDVRKKCTVLAMSVVWFDETQTTFECQNWEKSVMKTLVVEGIWPSVWGLVSV